MTLRRASISIAGERYAVLPLVTTVLMGAAGGWIAKALGAPLPWLLGAVVVIGASAVAGVRVWGAPVTFPIRSRVAFVPIIGVAIGGAFTPELLRAAAGWWPTLLGLALYVPLAHALSYAVYQRIGGYDRVTAYFSAMPGGLIEAIAMGEQAGADARALNLLQFSRLIMCILIVPLSITIYEGAAVGSAAGVAMEGSQNAIGLLDAILLIGSGVVGLVAARRIGMPAAIITGPIVASGIVHLAGWTEATPPPVLIAITQLVIGCTLGVRFVGMARGEVLKGLRMAFVSVALVLLLAVGMGGLLHLFVRESVEAVLLAFAPGGVIEMSLIALSLKISVVFVSAHHVARILWTVFAARTGYLWLRKHRGWP